MALAESCAEYYGGTVGDSVVVVDDKIAVDIIIGDDYLAANGRSFDWIVDAPVGLSADACTSVLSVWHPSKGAFKASGTCTDQGSGKWKLSHDVTTLHTSVLHEGEYEWNVAIVGPSGQEISVRKNAGDYCKVKVLEKEN